MSHTGVDVIDFLFYTIYPVIGIFIVEGISRLVKAPKWIKLWTQAIVSIGFGIYYAQPAYSFGHVQQVVGDLHLPIVEKLSKEVLALPVHPHLSEEDRWTIVETVNNL